MLTANQDSRINIQTVLRSFSVYLKIMYLIEEVLVLI